MAEVKATEKDVQIKTLVDKLEAGMKSLLDSERYREYLKTMASFTQYSYRNVLAIHTQMPSAQYVASFKKWKELGRHVKKGEKGLRIFAPLFIKKMSNKQMQNEMMRLIQRKRISYRK